MHSRHTIILYLSMQAACLLNFHGHLQFKVTSLKIYLKCFAALAQTQSNWFKLMVSDLTGLALTLELSVKS